MKKYFDERITCPVCKSEKLKCLYKVSYDDNEIVQYLKIFYNQQGNIELDYLKNTDYELSECHDCNLVFQRYIHNLANYNEYGAKSFKPVNPDAGLLYQIQQLIHKPNFDLNKSFEMIADYKQKNNLKIPVFSVNVWNKHILNWLGYFKDVSVLKILPFSASGKYIASQIQHHVNATIIIQAPRNTVTVDTSYGSFKSAFLNKWHHKYNFHDRDIIFNKADNRYNHWYTTDTFHPTVTIPIESIHQDHLGFNHTFKYFLDEIPNLDKDLKSAAAENFKQTWEQVLNDEFNGFSLQCRST